ncbi:hypothetical protein TNCV_5002241 [Trichonephila clavipes]|nr:hypothetical protein TNCV_5002241 [Trichonephila clavipes]
MGKELFNIACHALYPAEIYFMASAECMGGARARTHKAWNADCLVYRQRVLEGCNSKIQNHPKFDTLCMTSVVMNNTTASHHSVSRLQPTIVILQAVASFVSKPNVVPFRFPCLAFIAPLAA